ncbi:MAG: hypothetical protein M1816_000750 [Peltula sp. TS41687]|nr:MAG: hypothetical protein M1816_000750 [Peltula sp. TS41687]
MPMTWNDKADVRLFIALLKVHAIKPDYPALAQAMGPDCTAKAIMHRVTKLRSIAAEAENGGGSVASSSAPTTPKKPRGAKATNGGTAAAAGKGKGRKRTAKDIAAEDDHDDDEVGNGENGSLKIEDDGEHIGKRVKLEGLEEDGDDDDAAVQEVVDDEE